MRVAESGTLESFRTSLDERLAHGQVQLGEARDIAWRRARNEIEQAQGTADESGLAQIGDCAHLFGPALKRRAAQDDEIAAQATLLLIDAGFPPPMQFVGHLTSERDLWRAVAARSLTKATQLPVTQAAPPAAARLPKVAADSQEGLSAQELRLARAAQWRRRLMLDPAAAVRRAALLAAADAADPADGKAVLEAARLDPDAEIRAIAIEAAAQIGTLELVLGLEDLWTDAEQGDQVAIVAAWAAVMRSAKDSKCSKQSNVPACVARRRLRRVVEINEGTLGGVRAAWELIHDEPRPADAAAGQAAGLLERAIDEAPTAARIEAINGVPLSWAHLLEAIVEASSSEDEQVAVAALARMVELGGKERDASIEALRGHAKGTTVAEQAKLALVRAGDKKVIASLKADASAKSAETRREAASSLARIGAFGEALKLLADKDATVRAQSACAILGGSDGS